MTNDEPCTHKKFDAHVIVNRFADNEDGPVSGYHADIRVTCADCAEPFVWIGPEAGLSPHKPTVSVDGTELRAPVRPASTDPDFRSGLPGFSVVVVPS